MKKFGNAILYRDLSIMLTPPPLTTKAELIQFIGLINMNQSLKVTNFGGPH